MATRAQIAAVKRFERENCRRIQLTLNRRTDADIIAYLESVDSMQGEIKKALRQWMESAKKRLS